MSHRLTSHVNLPNRRLRRVARRALWFARKRGRLAISLAFVGDRTMRRLNRDYAGMDRVTDVLSFPAGEPAGGRLAPWSDGIYLGDVVVSLPQASRQARAEGHSPAREVDLLLAHGILHLLGYDHDTPRRARSMAALEQVIAQRR